MLKYGDDYYLHGQPKHHMSHLILNVKNPLPSAEMASIGDELLLQC